MDSPEIEQESRPLILLIHGTGAARTESSGAAWWQSGSRFAKDLQGVLGASYEVQPEDQVFHWSGLNRQDERVAAADALLKRFRILDAAGRDFHVVAHSHGGSVVLEAMLIAARKAERFDHLKSITTVGTPFLHFWPTPRWIANSVAVALSGAGLYVAVGPVRAIVDRWYELLHHQLSWPTTLLLAAAAVLLGCFVAALIRLLRGWSLVRAANRRRGALVAAERLVRRRWASYSAPADEAINALSVAGNLRSEVVPRTRAKSGALLETAAALLLWPFRALFNAIVAPTLDQFVAASLENRAFGGAVIGDYRFRCSAIPPLGSHLSRRLSDGIIADLETNANAALSQTVVSLRSSLETAATIDPRLAVVADEAIRHLTFGELIHTSYFVCADFIRLLADRIELLQADPEDMPPAEADEGTKPIVQGASPQAAVDPAAGEKRPGLAVLLSLRQTALVLALIPIVLVLDRAIIQPYTPQAVRDEISQSNLKADLLDYRIRQSTPVNIQREEPSDPNTCEPRQRSNADPGWPANRPGGPADFTEAWFGSLEQAGLRQAAALQFNQLLDADGRPAYGSRRSAVLGMMIATTRQRDASRLTELFEQLTDLFRDQMQSTPDYGMGHKFDDFEINGHFRTAVERVMIVLLSTNEEAAGVWLEPLATDYSRRRFPKEKDTDFKPRLLQLVLDRGHLEIAKQLYASLPPEQQRGYRTELWRGEVRVGRYDEALRDIDSIDFSTSNAWTIWFEPLIRWLRQQGRNDEAAALAQKALQATETATAGLTGAVGWRLLACMEARYGFPALAGEALRRVPASDLALVDLAELTRQMLTSGAWDGTVILSRLDELQAQQRELVLEEIVREVAKSGRFDDAITFTRRLEAADARRLSVGRVLALAAQRGELQTALDLLPLYLEFVLNERQRTNAGNPEAAADVQRWMADEARVNRYLDGEAATVLSELAFHATVASDLSPLQAAVASAPPEQGLILRLESARALIGRDRPGEALAILKAAVAPGSSPDGGPSLFAAAVDRIDGLRERGHVVTPNSLLTWNVTGAAALDEVDALNTLKPPEQTSWPKKLRQAITTLRAVHLARVGRLDEASEALRDIPAAEPQRMRADAILASRYKEAGRKDRASATVRSRPAVDRDHMADPWQPSWPVELFDAGLQEEALRLICDSLVSVSERDAPRVDTDATMLLNDLSYRFLLAGPRSGRAMVVHDLLAAMKLRDKDPIWARLSNLLLAQEDDEMARRFASSIENRALRTATMLLAARAASRAEVRKGLIEESKKVDGPGTFASYRTGNALHAGRAADQWKRAATAPETPATRDHERERARVLAAIVPEAAQVADAELRSALMLEISYDFARLGWLRTSLDACQDCLPGDRLRAALQAVASTLK